MFVLMVTKFFCRYSQPGADSQALNGDAKIGVAAAACHATISAASSERMLGRAGADGGGTGGAKGSCTAPRQPAQASLEERCCLAGIEQERQYEVPGQSRPPEPTEAGACFILPTCFTLSWTVCRMMLCQNKVPSRDWGSLQQTLRYFHSRRCRVRAHEP